MHSYQPLLVPATPKGSELQMPPLRFLLCPPWGGKNYHRTGQVLNWQEEAPEAQTIPALAVSIKHIVQIPCVFYELERLNVPRRKRGKRYELQHQEYQTAQPVVAQFHVLFWVGFFFFTRDLEGTKVPPLPPP